MAKLTDKPKKYACFTEEQQAYFDKLPKRQRMYVEFRGQGYNKTTAYKMAGFEGKYAGQAAKQLEARNSAISELIDVLVNNRKARELTQEETALSKQIDALAQQQKAEEVLEKIDGMDGEQARRIKFYRDIANGKIKTVRKTIKQNALGAVVETKIEEISDIDSRIKARKELDRLLGLQEILDIGSITTGDITINIVDASKKEELEDDRNKVVIDIDKVEEVDGEKVVVTEEKIESETASVDKDIPSESDKFFEVVGD